MCCKPSFDSSKERISANPPSILPLGAHEFWDALRTVVAGQYYHVVLTPDAPVELIEKCGKYLVARDEELCELSAIRSEKVTDKVRRRNADAEQVWD
uniref:Uncharacterized protein n=1 Tax=uncultured Bacteroidota bacterium TaxID=152509 RepID=H5SHK7_9BACT|nr:hypothetical protein HGMM_F29C06C26 [uncultured Bacteroidetes bacterium]